MKSRKLCVGLMLHIILIAVVGFSMIACEQATDAPVVNNAGDSIDINTPGDTTVTVIPDSLPEFTLDAQVYTGGALLTWDLVINAARYEVWRQASGKANVLLKTIGNQTEYADVKTRLNNLQAGDYTYTVVAVSEASTSQTAAPVVIQSSKAEKAVTFTEDNLAETTLAPITNLRLEVTPYSTVLATWDADANPLVSYEIYNRQDSDPDPYSGMVTVHVPAYAFALVGGTVADVIVRKVLFKSNIEHDIQFYNPSEDANASITVFNLSDATVMPDRDSNALVKLTLSNIPPVTGLASFELSRYIYADSNNANPTWTPVSLASARIVSSNIFNAYEVYDTLPANSETATILYRLMGKYPGVNNLRSVAYGTALPVYVTKSLAQITSSQLANGTYPVPPSNQYDDLEAFYHVNHSVESEVTYTYFLKQTLHSNGMPLASIPTISYDWVEITPTVTTENTSSRTVKVSLPEARPTYSLKIVPTGTGSKAGYISQERILTDLRLRQSIVPSGGELYAAGYYVLSYSLTQRGQNINTNGDPVSTVYSMGLSGLSSSSGQPLLRVGEALEIELVSRNNAPIQPNRQSVTRAQIVIRNDQTNSTATLDPDYYFTVPVVPAAYPEGEYEVRLYVTAR